MRVHQRGATGKKGYPAIMVWHVPRAALQPNSMLLSMLSAGESRLQLLFDPLTEAGRPDDRRGA